jgi:GMP synthase-like glutamine amidotransferase
MTKKEVTIFQHVPFEDLGSIRPWLEERQVKINYTRFFAADPMPDTRDVGFLIVLGGPMSVNDENNYPWLVTEKQFIRDAVSGNIPVLGICLGAQLLAVALGGRVYKNRHKEIGWYPVYSTTQTDSAFRFPREFPAFHWHGETFDLPPLAVQLARSNACRQQAFQIKKNVLGLQFHLETTAESVSGLIDNCRRELTGEDFVQTEQQLQAVPPAVYIQCHTLMAAILDYLTRD